jgi:hypothetical protein
VTRERFPFVADTATEQRLLLQLQADGKQQRDLELGRSTAVLKVRGSGSLCAVLDAGLSVKGAQ